MQRRTGQRLCGTLGDVKCQATLRLYSERLPAADVSTRLGLEPTSLHERGDRLGKRTRAVAKVSGWNLSTQMREPNELSEHLSELLDRVEPVREPCASG